MRFTASYATTALLAASLLGIAGCSEVSTGLGARNPDADPGVVNVKLLDPGTLPTKPRESPGEANTVEVGRRLEARRMAEAVLVPFEVNPDLAEQSRASGPFSTPDEHREFRSLDEIDGGATDHNLIAGFQTSASSNTSTAVSLTHIVLRFATPEDATVAATKMADLRWSNDESDDWVQTREIITGRPEIHAISRSYKGNFDHLMTYSTHGVYVIVDKAGEKSFENAQSLILIALNKQLPRLDGFTPTPVDKLADLPIDPTGLAARTEQPLGKQYGPDVFGVYGPHGALHFMKKPAQYQIFLTENGLTNLSTGSTMIYEFSERAGATRLADEFSAELEADTFNQYRLDDPVPGMPSARCYLTGRDHSHYRCVLPTDRYLIEIHVGSREQAIPLLAAQYLMLTAK